MLLKKITFIIIARTMLVNNTRVCRRIGDNSIRGIVELLEWNPDPVPANTLIC
jgi:hypothetical protein